MQETRVNFKLRVDRDDLVCDDGAGKEFWKLPVTSLRVIAESTNALGPFVDDWFLIFGYRENGENLFRDVPVISGVDAVLSELGTRLGVDIRLRLVQSTMFDSRVLWPERLVGKLFYLQQGEERTGALAGIVTAILGQKKKMKINSEVLIAMSESGRA
jgi:hypothetical protein